MDISNLSALTTGEWVVAAGSAAALLLSLVPVLWACLLFVEMSDAAVANAIDDAQRTALLKDRLRRSRP